MEQTKISAPQNGHASHAVRAKSPLKQGISDAGNDAGSNGFLALLSAMGDALGDAPVLTVADAVVVPADLMADGPAGAVDASAAAWHGLFGATLTGVQAGTADGLAGTGNTAIAGSSGITGNTGIAGVMGTSNFAGDTGGRTTAVDTFGAVGGAMMVSAWNGLALDGRNQGLVAETMKLDTSVDFKDSQPFGATTMGSSRAGSRLQGAQAQRAGASGALESATGQIVSGESAQHRFGGHLATAPLAQSMNERGSPSAQQTAAAAERLVSALASPVGTQLAGALTGDLVSALVSNHGADALGGRGAGEGQPGANAGAAGGLTSAAQETGSVDGAPTFSEANPMGAEEQVADQVAYWVNQKTQNAEMTLHQDGQPVEVSVSLSGNEAHVSFRSDQPETRALLDQSMAQLSEMLLSEGLVLSGMSVSTSAQGGSGANAEERQSGGREGARHAQVVSKAPSGTSSLVRGAVTSDRAVDIFV